MAKNITTRTARPKPSAATAAKKTARSPGKTGVAAKPASRATSNAVRTGRKVDAPLARPRGVGRPPRLSPEMIIEASIALLREVSAEGFTLARVADRLATVSMALYNYFPSREALLAEVANHISKQFQMPKPKPGQNWKKTLRDWLWTLLELGQKYPVIFKISGVDGKTSAGWLRITLVPGRILEDLGFTGKDLALANWLLCMQAHALIQAEVTDAGFHSGVSLSRLEELEASEQSHFLSLRPFQAQISASDIMEQGFLDIVATIERKMPSR